MPRLPPRANARRVAAGSTGIGAQRIGRPLDHGRASLLALLLALSGHAAFLAPPKGKSKAKKASLCKGARAMNESFHGKRVRARRALLRGQLQR